MNYTKGEWQPIQDNKDPNRYHIIAFDEDGTNRNVCLLSVREPSEHLANAHLIAAAVNACASVNPDNPLAVAESIKDMYEALTLTGNFLKGFKREFPHLFKKSDSEWVRFNAIIEQALTKAEGK